MKNITLRFIGLGYDNICQAKVQIYDECGNLICEECTYNNRIEACLEWGRYYHIICKFRGEIIDTVIRINRNTYTFIFPHAYYNNTPRRDEETITLLLTDYNYYGLPIMKGEINLWPKL